MLERKTPRILPVFGSRLVPMDGSAPPPRVMFSSGWRCVHPPTPASYLLSHCSCIRMDARMFIPHAGLGRKGYFSLLLRLFLLWSLVTLLPLPRAF